MKRSGGGRKREEASSPLPPPSGLEDAHPPLTIPKAFVLMRSTSSLKH